MQVRRTEAGGQRVGRIAREADTLESLLPDVRDGSEVAVTLNPDPPHPPGVGEVAVLVRRFACEKKDVTGRVDVTSTVEDVRDVTSTVQDGRPRDQSSTEALEVTGRVDVTSTVQDGRVLYLPDATPLSEVT